MGSTGHSGSQAWGRQGDKSRPPQAGANGVDRKHSGPGWSSSYRTKPSQPHSPGSSGSHQASPPLPLVMLGNVCKQVLLAFTVGGSQGCC